MSVSRISRSRRVTSLFGKRASGRRPRSSTTSIKVVWSGRPWTASTMSGGRAARSRSRSSAASRSKLAGTAVTGPPGSAVQGGGTGSSDGRHEGRLRYPDKSFLEQQGDARLNLETGLLEPAVNRRFVGSNRRDHAVLRFAAIPGPGGDHAQTVLHQRPDVRIGQGQDLQVVGLILQIGRASCRERV